MEDALSSSTKEAGYLKKDKYGLLWKCEYYRKDSGLMTDIEKMKKIREKIIALNESDAKSVLMLTATNIYRVNSGDGSFTSDKCVDELIRLYNSIPEPK